MNDILKKYSKPIILACAIAAGLILIFFSDEILKDDSEKICENVSELERYGASLEEKLARTIEKIDGAGSVRVMISFESSFEKVYASNARLEENGIPTDGGFDKTTEKQLVLAGSGTAGESPILIKEMCPKVRGIVVVYDGRYDKETENKIRQAVVSLFGISELRVCITKG